MKFLTILFFLTSIISYGQTPKISLDWENELIEKFDTISFSKLSRYDFSKIISNQLRIDKDPWSTYIGVFGPNNRRIDFHIEARKIDSIKYSIIGKSKLGDNIREINGEINFRYFLKSYKSNIVLFEYKFNEPGDLDGDGYFLGIGSIVFKFREKEPAIYWSESGHYRDYNNMFVGVWNRFDSDVSRECIFSFEPSGTYSKLPFRDYLYKEFDENNKDDCKCYFEIKDEFRQYGWEDYDDSNGYKEYWWK